MTTCINTHDQLVAAGGGVAIVPAYTGARSNYRNGWHIYRVNAKGQPLVTDKTAHWTDHHRKHFPDGDSRAEALEEAKRWVAETYGERGPWVRNRMGAYLPARIHEVYPLRPQLRRKKT